MLLWHYNLTSKQATNHKYNRKEWFYQSNHVLQLGWLIIIICMIDWEIWI